MSHSFSFPLSRRGLLARRGLAATIFTVATAAAAPHAASAAALPSEPASMFRDSIGVQTHFPFTGYAYDRANLDDIGAMLRTIGVNHLRDDTCFLDDESDCRRVRDRIAGLRDAFGAEGPKVDLLALTSRELAAVPDRAARNADIERALTAAATPPLAGMISAIEPVNEPDLKESIDWEAATIADDDTYRRLLAQPRFAGLRGLPRLSPAIGHAKNTPLLLQRGWNRSRAAVGNFHPYPPAWGGPENALATACGTTDALGCAAMLGQTPEPWATESGYSTSGTAVSTNWVSERAQAVYLPRVLLENFRRGVGRTYLYELIDLRPDYKPLVGSAVDGFGLWRTRQVGTAYLPAGPKPAALAISRMNETIGDLGAGTAAPASLDVTVRTGGTEAGDDTVRRVLLRRADGSYVLALWQPEAVWRNTVMKQGEIPVDDLATEVAVSGGPWNVTATRPTNGEAPTGTWSGAQRWTVPVGADVTLLELHRVGGDDPGTGAPATGVGRDPYAAAQAAITKAAWDWLTGWFAASLR